VLAGAMQPRDHVLFAIIWTEDLDVAFRKTRSAKTLRHRLRSSRHIAYRVCGVDLDQLFEHVESELLCCLVHLGIGTGCQQQRTEQ